jgi:dipeptidyl-peptidase 4
VTTFPRQQARTRRFTLGVPRAFTTGIGPDGPLVLFLRSDTGDDPVTHLWHHDPSTGETRKLFDAGGFGSGEELPPEERARRERAREQAGGITAYAVDRDLQVAAFALAGRLITVDVASGQHAEHPVVAPAFDPRPSPDGTLVAYHAADGLHLVELHDGAGRTGSGRSLVQEPDVSWGRAEFVAAEEMGRSRGYWWSPDSSRLAVARVDERRVPVWHVADPTEPWRPAVPHRYPAAGTSNADVSLWLVDVGTGERLPVASDRPGDEYLADVSWGPGPLTVLVQPRDQRTARVLTVEPETGETTPVREWSDEAWVELVPGSPAWAGELLLTVEDRADRGHGGTRTLCADGAPVTPEDLQVRGITHASDGFVAFLASGADPTQEHAYRLNLEPPHDLAVWSVTDGEPGVHREVSGWSAEAPWVRISHGLDRPHPRIRVIAVDPDGGATLEHELEVVAEVPLVTARPRLLELGPRKLRSALFLPSEGANDGPLPVLLDPYGGPHAQRVVQAHSAHLASQYLADQGFAVLVVDGRGTPGRGPRFERAVHHDLATPVLEDQITALQAAARLEPRLDLSRVGIRGWSFGGYLAALAVLRRPDVFHAAVAAAPVTDWHLYDTHYTERYLGHPRHDAEAYRVSSLVDEDGQLVDAAPWSDTRPPELLLIHGLADDNVVAAHALRLSRALLAVGRPHRFLPLSGVTHMTPQVEVAQHLLGLQVRFLQEALRSPSAPPVDQVDRAG